MKRLLAIFFLALGLIWIACGDDDDDGNPIGPPTVGDSVDIDAFTGCWHIRSASQIFGSPGPCRTALDSVMDILTVAGGESLFAVVDTVTHLTLVEPYYGNGDFTGTSISGRAGTVMAQYLHDAGSCSLRTRFEGDISASGDTAFFINYIVNIQFLGDSECTGYGGCSGLVTFTCKRRPDSRCEP